MTGGLFGGKWKRRFCELDTFRFSYYNGEKAPQYREKPRKSVPISLITGVRKPPRSTVSRNYVFQILTSQRGLVITLAADSEDELALWMQCIQMQCDQLLYEKQKHTDGGPQLQRSKFDAAQGKKTVPFRPAVASEQGDDKNPFNTNKGHPPPLPPPRRESAISPSNVSSLRSTFQAFESKKFVGYIPIKSFGQLLVVLGVTGLNEEDPNSTAEVQDAIDELDPEKHGLISFKKFDIWWKSILDAQEGDASNRQSTANRRLSLEGNRKERIGLRSPFDSQEEMDWNEKYQTLMDLTLSCTFPDNVKHSLGVSNFVGEFVEVAREAVETIISEMTLPPNLKTIRPEREDDVSLDVFIYKGILISLVGDPSNSVGNGQQNFGLLDDPEVIARKQASHEIHGLSMALAGVTKSLSDNIDYESRVCTLLMCLVDFVGFRFQAVALAPVSDTSMIYGKDINGDFINTRPDFEDLLIKVGKAMLSKSHLYVTQDGRQISLPCSMGLQGHCCNDGRYYILEYSKCLPADLPEAGSNDVIVKQLRPEFLTAYARPLSSDAFYAELGNVPDRVENDMEACHASKHLLGDVICTFTHKLNNLEIVPYDSVTFTNALHSAGINIRHIARILSFTTLPHLVDLIIVEMVARTCKLILFRNLRLVSKQTRNDIASKSATIKKSRESVSFYDDSIDRLFYNQKTVVLDFFNLVLGSGVESESFWNKVLLPAVRIKFSFEGTISKSTIYLNQLFHALQYHTCSQFQDHCYNFNRTEHPLAMKDLINLYSMITLPTNNNLECHKIAAKAEVYKHERDYENALQAFNLRLALNHTSGAEDLSTLRMLNDVASTHLCVGDVANTIRCATAALRDAPKYTAVAGTLHMTLMKAYMSNSNDGGKNEDEALKHFKSGLEATELHLGGHHPLVNEFFASLGELYLSSKMYDKAHDMLQIACDKSITILGSEHPLIAIYSTKLGHVCIQKNEFDKSGDLYSRAMKINEKHYGNDSTITASSYHLYAEALWHRGCLAESYEYAKKALQIRESSYGAGHPKTMQSYTFLAKLAESHNDPNRAIKYLEKKLVVLKSGLVADNVNDLKEISKDIIRLKFRAQPMYRKEAIKRAREEYPDVDGNKNVMQFVIAELFEHSPSEYIDKLLNIVAGDITNDDDEDSREPPPALQLSCVAHIGKWEESKTLSHQGSKILRVRN